MTGARSVAASGFARLDGALVGAFPVHIYRMPGMYDILCLTSGPDVVKAGHRYQMIK